jgi:hypothetical protein
MRVTLIFHFNGTTAKKKAEPTKSSARRGKGVLARVVCSVRCAFMPAFRQELLHPVLNPQAGDSLEVALVVGNKRQAVRKGMRCNPDIVILNHLAAPLEVGLDLTKAPCNSGREGQEFHLRYESPVA